MAAPTPYTVSSSASPAEPGTHPMKSAGATPRDSTASKTPIRAQRPGDHSVTGAARLFLFAALSFLAFLAFLGADALHYTVSDSGNEIVIRVVGQDLRVEAFTPGAPISVLMRPQERYSSPQVLVQDHGVVRNGLALLRALLTPRKRNPDQFREFPQASGQAASYAHLNPFRASFVVRQANRDLRLEVNVPDNSIELWRDNSKTHTIKLKTPWLPLTFFPVFAAIAAAACFASLLAAFGARDEVSVAAEENAMPPRPSRIALAALFVAGFVATVLFSGSVFHH